MKITPIAMSGEATSMNLDEGKSAGQDRLARAKALLSGEVAPESGTQVDHQVDRAQASIRKIKMRTQGTPSRYQPIEAAPPAPGVETAPAETDTLAQGEPTLEASEATKPLSPQFAALAKEKRALQAMKRELEAQKAAQTQPGTMKALEDYRARLKTEALRVLQEEGVTYDQLTEQILASGQDNSPAFSRLEAEIKALKEGLENQTKSMTQRDQDSEKQALALMTRDADKLVAQGDDYEMVREAGYTPKAIELIHRVYKQSGEIMDVAEALTLIENELLEDSLKFARLKKVQSRLTPAAPAPAAKPSAPNTQTMRTLTNRDGRSAISLSKRERAIAVMEGRIK